MRIDIVADVAQGVGPHNSSQFDGEVMRLASSVSIACGFHGGDPARMRNAIKRAVEHEVGIGAQVGYQDIRGGGETELSIPTDMAISDVLYQLGALHALATAEQEPLQYIAPYGALGRRIAADPAFALILAVEINKVLPGLPVMLLAASPGANALRNSGIAVLRVAYADHAYLSTNAIAPSTRPGAMLTDEQITRQAVQLAIAGPIDTLDGDPIQLHVDSITLMRQSPLRFTALSAALKARGILITQPR